MEILEDNSAVVYWFSFDTAGNRRWFFGAGALDNGTWVFPTLYTTAGPVFGAGFDPTQLDVQPWGRLELDLSCDGGEARYISTEDDCGSGSMPLVQFTRMDGPACPLTR